MSHEIIIPNASAVPAFAKAAADSPVNADALFGVSPGMYPRIKLNGKAFVLIDAAGEETNIMPTEMMAGPDGNIYMAMIPLRAKKEILKTWYATKYNPNAEEVKAPDCFSNDGVRPDTSVITKQSETCVVCPHNAFGTGKDQEGNFTKGKACSDTKVVAMYVPKKGVYALRIPPASLKNFANFVNKLGKSGIALNASIVLVGFDVKETYPVLTFQHGGFVPEASYPQLVDMAENDPVVKDIISAPAAIAAPAPAAPAPAAPAPAAEIVDSDPLGLGDIGGGAAPDPDPLGLGAVGGGTAPTPAAPTNEAADLGLDGGVSDADIIAQLDL